MGKESLLYKNASKSYFSQLFQPPAQSDFPKLPLIPNDVSVYSGSHLDVHKSEKQSEEGKRQQAGDARLKVRVKPVSCDQVSAFSADNATVQE